MEIGPIVRAMKPNKTRFGMIILEIAITLAIVTNAVNMIIDERKKMAIPSGFDDDNLVWVRARPFLKEFQEDRFLELSINADLAAMKSIPGVKSAVNSNFIPWQGGGSSTEVRVSGEQNKHRTQSYYGTHEIFDTLDMKVIEGRAFSQSDMPPLSPPTPPGVAAPPSPPPTSVIITKALADLLFKDGKALGKRIEQGDGSQGYTVVGVVDDFYNPYGWPIHYYSVFFPSPVGSYQRGVRYLIRMEPGSARAVLPALEQRLLQENPGRTLEVKTIPDVKDQYFAGGRIVVTMMTGLIVLLIAVTAIGILGIASFSVTERTRQIGTRRALGATRVDILRYFLLENWLITTAGLLIGVAAAYGLNVLLVTQVAGVKLGWPLIMGGVLLLWGIGLAATLAPALRGSSLSPAVATRSV